VEVSKEQSLNDIFLRLSSLGIDVLSMRNKVNRLEEIFMRLVEARTGAEAAEGGSRPADSPKLHRPSEAAQARRGGGRA
jgi:hypothetical protein